MHGPINIRREKQFAASRSLAAIPTLYRILSRTDNLPFVLHLSERLF